MGDPPSKYTLFYPFGYISHCLVLLQLPPLEPPLPQVRTRPQMVVQSQWWLDLKGVSVSSTSLCLYLPGAMVRGSSEEAVFHLIL